MAKGKMSLAELSAKIEWEGGYIAALEYGIKASDLADPEAAALWAKLENIYNQEFMPLTRDLDSILDDVRDDE